jgi:hypothetical protein
MVCFMLFFVDKLTNQHYEFIIPTIMNASNPKNQNSYLNIFAISVFLFGGYLCNAQVGINTITPNSTLEVNGSLGHKITAISATTLLDETHNTVVCDNGVNPITINLPTAISPACNGRIYTVKKGASSSAAVTIDGYQSETIDGAASFLLTDDLGTVAIVSDGAEWKIISKHLSPYPLGEISYFKIAGTTIVLPGKANANDITQMVVCAVSTPSATNLQSKPANEFTTDGTGKLTYNGKTARTFHIACTISATATNTAVLYVFAVGKNGDVIPTSRIIQRMASATDTQSTAMHVVAELAQGDYLQLMAGNTSNASQNVSINSLCLFALGM